MIKKCECGSKLYPHGKFLNKENFLIQKYLCFNCGKTNKEITNIKINFKEPKNPICENCNCKMQKWEKRYKIKNLKESIIRSYRCRKCGKYVSIEIPCEIKE